MTDFSSKMFDTLLPTLPGGHWFPMPELERIMDVEERGLQSKKGNPGLLDRAADEIFNEKGIFLITRTGKGGGAKLTKDLKIIQHAKKTREDHANSDLIWVRRLEQKIARFQQLRLLA